MGSCIDEYFVELYMAIYYLAKHIRSSSDMSCHVQTNNSARLHNLCRFFLV